MKDIFSIICPISGDIKAISKRRYGKLPSDILSNPDFFSWNKNLKEKHLKPIFRILDKTPNEDLDLIFEMYLGLFKAWNLELFNFSYPKKYEVFKRAIESPYTGNQYMITDLGYLKEKLDHIAFEINHKRITSTDRNFLIELIIYCGLNCLCDYPWDKIPIPSLTWKDVEKIASNENIATRSYSFLYNIDYLSRSDDNENLFFQEIYHYPIENIINCLNHLFAHFQIRISFTKQIWDNAYSIIQYLHNRPEYNRKYEVVQMFSDLESEKENWLSDQEFDERCDLTHEEIMEKI
ncbi:MAG: hypothetical protein RIC06_00420 [Cyclobacteriaceae bacterium]